MNDCQCSQCGKPRDRYRDAAHKRQASYCKRCHALYMRVKRIDQDDMLLSVLESKVREMFRYHHYLSTSGNAEAQAAVKAVAQTLDDLTAVRRITREAISHGQ